MKKKTIGIIFGIIIVLIIGYFTLIHFSHRRVIQTITSTVTLGGETYTSKEIITTDYDYKGNKCWTKTEVIE